MEFYRDALEERRAQLRLIARGKRNHAQIYGIAMSLFGMASVAAGLSQVIRAIEVGSWVTASFTIALACAGAVLIILGVRRAITATNLYDDTWVEAHCTAEQDESKP